MPKLTKQAFFPCNPHTAVRSATVYAAAATPGAAQSGSGSSRLLGSLRDTSQLAKHGAPSNARLCQKKTPPCRMQLRPGAWRALLPTAGYQHGAKDCPALLFSRAPEQAPEISSWHLAGSWMGRGGSAAPVFLAEEHPHEGDGRWLCRLARAARGARLSARVWQSFV